MTESMRRIYLAELEKRIASRSRVFYSCEIVDEMSCHLDERVEDLLAGGQTLSAAIDIALSELGDAGDLADAFLSVQSEQRRRRIMRFTLTMSATVAVIALGCFLSWPGNGQLANNPATVAQEQGDPFADTAPGPEKKKQPARQPAASAGLTVDAATREIEERLRETIVVSFFEDGLKDALDIWAAETDSQVYVKWHRLEDLAIDDSTPIKLELSAPANTVLEFILDQVETGIQYAIRDGIVVISTEDDLLSSTMSVRIYDCSDLLRTGGGDGDMMGAAAMMGAPGGGMAGGSGMMGGAGGMMGRGSGGLGAGFGGGEMDAGGGDDMADGFGMGPGRVISPVASNQTALHLIQIIQNTVDADTWSQYGGPGAIAEFNGMLIVNQNDRTHRRVDSLLQMMREAGSAKRRK